MSNFGVGKILKFGFNRIRGLVYAGQRHLPFNFSESTPSPGVATTIAALEMMVAIIGKPFSEIVVIVGIQ